MAPVAEQVVLAKETKKVDATKKQIRGSSLLLVGKVLSVGLNFASQVLIVRFLSTTDYGFWGIALAVVAFFQPFSTFGLKRAITRFIPIYHEREEFDKIFGTILLVLSTVLITGVVFIGGMFLFPEQISRLINDGGSTSIHLILIMIFLVPVEAMDGSLMGLFASFANPKVILYQKHLLMPGLRLAVVLLLILFGSSVLFLAYGYLAASCLGVLIYCIVFVRIIKKQGVLKHFKFNSINVPAKEIFAFTLPLLTSDLVNILMHSTDTLILSYFHGATEVALYRVILPAAHFNKLVMISFAFLYTPLAARLFAKNDFRGINDLYWRTAIWMGVLSFPIFALTFSLAKPLTVALYGARYEQSWVLLQLLSVGYYFNVVLGFNGLTLKVLGKVKYIVWVNITAAVVNLVGNLLLIPKYGALGATIATAGSMILHNILKQAGLRMATGLSVFDRQYISFYLIIVFSAVGIYLVQLFISSNIFVGLGLVALVSFFVLKACEKKLKIEETFPEIGKLPFMRYIFNLNGK